MRQARQARPLRGGRASKDWLGLVRQAKRRGWTAKHTANGHVRLDKDGHQPLFLSLNGGDPRALKNMRALIRRTEQQ